MQDDAVPPFELVGAPWLDGHALARALERERIPGCGFRAAAFTPTFQKHADVLCHGVQVHVTDRRRFPAFLAYLLLIHHARRQEPEPFVWRAPPYEYEYVKLPFDILCGTDRVRKAIDACRRVRNPVLAFPKGRYDFWPEPGFERPYFESNTTNDGPKRLAILIESMDGLIVDGGGSTFVFHDRIPRRPQGRPRLPPP